MKHLRVFLILIAMLLGVAGTAIFTANAGAPVGRSALTPRAYLPLIAHSSAPTATPTKTPTATPTSTRTATPANTPTNTPGPGGWITLLEEGFEITPGPLWRFLDDNGANFGAYQWGRRDCRPYAGSYSAWAVGGGADGELLPCNSTYPDKVATTMTYGPFSLADAKMAQMRFKLRYDQVLSSDGFCWIASDAPVLSDATVKGGLCLNAQPIGWTTLDLDLGDLTPGFPGTSVLGKPQVWVRFRFTSDGAGHVARGTLRR